MSYRTVLFAIDEDLRAESHIDHAVYLARAFQARLVGLGCHRPTPWPAGAAVTCIDGDPLTVELREAEDAAVAREGVFLQRCHLAGLPGSEAILERSEMASAVCRHALCADLVIVAQPTAADPHIDERRRRLHVILQDSVHPVLVLPQDEQFSPLPGTVVVAWDGSGGAARAASAALPLLRRAAGVHLVQVADPRKEDVAALRPQLERVAAWLSGHGVAMRAEIAPSQLPVAQALRLEAAKAGAELLVMGAWGHRRLVERLLGGATRTMIDDPAVPILFAH